MNPILKVTNADYVRDYVLRLSFNDGSTKLVDFWPLAQKGICTKLQNLDYFRNYSLDPFTVDWSKGQRRQRCRRCFLCTIQVSQCFNAANPYLFLNSSLVLP